MEGRAKLIVLILLSFFFEAGHCAGRGTIGHIVGGSPTDIRQHPWQVSLRSGRRGSHFCGGSIISSRWVITAAHCLGSRNLSVVAGITDRNERARAYPVIGSFRPRDGADIALLQIGGRGFTFGETVGQINLPLETDVVADGTALHITGWGTTSSGGSLSATLLEATVNAVSNAECNASYNPEGYTVANNEICAAASNRDSCQGDSGGPMAEGRGNSAVLIGVVSWGIGCAHPDFPGVYARVSSSRAWIRNRAGV